MKIAIVELGNKENIIYFYHVFLQSVEWEALFWLKNNDLRKLLRIKSLSLD